MFSRVGHLNVAFLCESSLWLAVIPHARQKPSPHELPSSKQSKIMKLMLAGKDVCEVLSRNFTISLAGDFYPWEKYEAAFGIQMSSAGQLGVDVEEIPMGVLVYNTWSTMYKVSFGREGLRALVLSGLRNGNLPEQFRAQVIQFMGLEFGMYYGYVRELVRRGFQDIPWDYELLRNIAILCNGDATERSAARAAVFRRMGWPADCQRIDVQELM